MLQGHISAAAEAICTVASRELSLDELSKATVRKFVKITLPSPSSPKISNSNDMYATEVMTLGLIWEILHDATREIFAIDI